MSKDNNIPLCYQITVSNIIKIGDKVMSDFYVIFKSAQKNQNTWQSPVIHGRLTKENSNFPWTFIIDNPKLTVDFCEVDDKSKKGKVTGSTPLLLMKKEGEEQFLIFGCNQQNRGRKVAQVQFNYVQCSLARSSGTDDAKKKTTSQRNESDSNKRVDLDLSSQNQAKPSGLNIILQQQDAVRQTLGQSDIDQKKYQTINPSKMETLQYTYRHDKSNSQNDFQVLRQMEDASDKWYRSNFGKNKPTNLDNIQLQNENSLLPVKYTRQFEHLGNLSSVGTHIQLKDILLTLDKRSRAIEVFGISIENQQIKKTKIASVCCKEGYRKDWKTIIRLPVEAKGFELEIITDKNQRYYSMIGNDGHYEKNKVDIYDDEGEAVGNVLFSLKLIKTMEIQTLSIVLQNPRPQKYEHTVNEELNLSFIKSTQHFASKDKSTKLQKQSYLIRRLEQHTSLVNPKLQNQAYFSKNKSKFENPPFRAPQKDANRQNASEVLKKNKFPQQQVGMNNQPYIGKNPLKTKGRFRRNQYELAENNYSAQASEIAEPKRYHTLSQQNNKTKLIEDFKTQPPSEKFYQAQKKPTKRQLLKLIQPSKDKMRRQPSTIHGLERKNHSNSSPKEEDQPYVQNQLQMKIKQIKKLSSQLQRIAKNSSSPTKFKTEKSQDSYFNPIQREKDFSRARKVQYPNDSEQQKAKIIRKKTYRDPINVTPFFTSLSNQNFIKNYQQKSRIRQNVEEELPLKNKYKKYQPQQQYSPRQLQKVKQIYNQSQRLKMNKKADNLKQKEDSIQRELGVNTDRMAIVKNILQTSYMPQSNTEKRSQKDKQKNNHEEQNRQETGSNFDSFINENLNHHTKYSSQTIQPTTNQVLLDFLLVTISVQTYQNIFGGKFLRVFVPNKYHYQTQKIKNSNNLIWECKGMVFNRISTHQNLFIELVSESMQNNLKIGKAKIGGVEFKHVKKQGVIRSYLVYQNEVVGEVILTFKNASKNNELNANDFIRNKKNNTSNYYKPIELLEKQTEKMKTPKKSKSKSPKKSKSKSKKRSESLSDVIKSKRKQKLSRYVPREQSRVQIDSRVNPIRQKRYQGGKNIIIGRNIRFPSSEEQQFHKIVPGPGAYEPRTDFKKYS